MAKFRKRPNGNLDVNSTLRLEATSHVIGNRPSGPLSHWSSKGKKSKSFFHFKQLFRSHHLVWIQHNKNVKIFVSKFSLSHSLFFSSNFDVNLLEVAILFFSQKWLDYKLAFILLPLRSFSLDHGIIFLIVVVKSTLKIL